MRKNKLPKRESEICARLREAREFLGITQDSCARQIGIERTTLANYEYEKAALKYEVALRFCRQLVISEEWLATGRFAALEKEAARRRIVLTGGAEGLKAVFLRQCMDLLSESVSQRIPPGEWFGEAYDKFLVRRYAELAQQSFYAPRIVFSDADNDELGLTVFGVYVERWVKMLGNEARGLKRKPWDAQRSFLRSLIEADSHIFRRFMGFKSTPETSDHLAWLRSTLEDHELLLGPLHGEHSESTQTSSALALPQN